MVTTARNERFVVRKKPPGRLLPGAHQIEREYQVQCALKGSGVPVPEMIVLCEDERVIGQAFYVMRCVGNAIAPKVGRALPASPSIA